MRLAGRFLLLLSLSCEVHGSDFPTCYSGFVSLGFNTLDFPNYPNFFNETSTVRLAPAGQFQGLDPIEEYMRFVDPNSNSIVLNVTFHNDTIQYGGFADGVCSFLAFSKRTYELGENANNATVDMAVLSKLKYDPVGNKVTFMGVYYEPEFVTQIFTVLTTPKTWEYVCGVLMSSCNDVWTLNGWNDTDQCVNDFSALQLLTNGTHFDGLDQGCKYLHATMVEFNPDHCPHVSIVPMQDSHNKTKCQTSAMTPTDIDFTASDIIDFRQYLEDNGLPPSGVQVFIDGCSGSQLAHLVVAVLVASMLLAD